MGSPVKRRTPPNQEQPNFAIVRKTRMDNFQYLLKKAQEEGNIGLERKFQKEYEIQHAYMQLEAQ